MLKLQVGFSKDGLRMCFRQVPEDNNLWRSYIAQYFGLEIR